MNYGASAFPKTPSTSYDHKTCMHYGGLASPKPVTFYDHITCMNYGGPACAPQVPQRNMIIEHMMNYGAPAASNPPTSYDKTPCMNYEGICVVCVCVCVACNPCICNAQAMVSSKILDQRSPSCSAPRVTSLCKTSTTFCGRGHNVR